MIPFLMCSYLCIDITYNILDVLLFVYRYYLHGLMVVVLTSPMHQLLYEQEVQ